MKTRLKNTLNNLLFNEINYFRLFICMVVGLLITGVIYTGSHVRYYNISDFYVGSTLYTNFNKSFDKILPYLYTLITLLLYIIRYNQLKVYLSLLVDKFLYIEKFIQILYKKNNNPILLTVGFITILFLTYSNPNFFISPDNYHFGEKLIGNVINNFSLKLYIDYFPAHGLSDIIPSWIGINLFKDNSIYGILLGHHLFYYILVAILTFLSLITLPFGIAILGVLLAHKYGVILPSIYILMMYFLITNENIKKNFYIYSIIFCTCAYLLYALQPTMGAPFIISIIFPYFYQLYNFYKSKSKQKIILYLCAFLFFNCTIFLLFKDFYINNFAYILTNFKSNLVAFGNIGIFNPYTVTIKSAQYLLLPFFILLLFENFSKNEKQIDNIMLLLALIIYPFFISTYSLGRLDSSSFYRVYIISYSILIFICPMLLNRKRFKIFQHLYMLIFIFLGLLTIIELTNSFFKEFKVSCIDAHQTNYNSGNPIFNENHLNNLNNISELINKSTDRDYSFLDLTNQGALYFYLNKKPLIPYIAYYNIPSPQQDKLCADKLKKNLPDIVLIKGGNIMHDDLPLSLRANNIYKTILLSNKYQVIANDKITILKKVDKHKFNDKEIYLLEDALGFSEIQQLPNVYGVSKKLTELLKEQSFNYKITKENGSIIINFDKPINGSLVDFIYFYTKNKHGIYHIKINGSDTNIISCKHKLLVPIDIHPNVLLNSITSIEINTDNALEGIENIEDIKFYKRIDKENSNETLNF